MIWVVVVVFAVALVGYLLYTRRGYQETGVTRFQRHIDALSPEARRESFERVRPQLHQRDGEDR